MPLVKTAAIVLHSRKWGDADRIVTFYTMRLGRIEQVVWIDLEIENCPARQFAEGNRTILEVFTARNVCRCQDG